MGYHYYQSKPGFKPQMDNTPKNTKKPDDKEKRQRQKTTAIGLSVLMVLATLIVGYEVIFSGETIDTTVAVLEDPVVPMNSQIDKVQSLRRQLLETNQRLEEHKRKLFAKAHPTETEKLAELSHELGEKVKLNETYKTQIQTLEQNREQLSQQILEMENALINLAELADAQHGTILIVSSDYSSKVNQLEDHLKKHRESLWHTNLELENIRDRAFDLHTHLEAQYDIEKSFKSKIEELSRNLESEKYNKQSIDAMLQDLLAKQEESERQMKEILVQAARNESEKNQLLAQGKTLSQDYMEMEEVLNLLTRANDTLNQEKQQIELAYLSEKENSDRLSHDLNEALALNKELNEETSNAKRLEIELRDSLAIREELNQANIELIAKQNYLSVLLAKYQDEMLQNAVSVNDEIEQKNHALAKYEEEIRTAHANSERLENELNVRNKELSTLKLAQENSERLVSELKNLHEEIRTAHANSERLESELNVRNEELSTLKLAQENSERLESELKNLHEEIRTAHANSERLESELNDALVIRDEINFELSTKQHELTELTAKYNYLENDLKDVIALREELKSAQANASLLSESQTTIATLEKHLEDSSKELHALIQENNSLNESLRLERSRTESEQEKTMALQEDLQKKINTLSFLQEHRADQSQELNNVHEEVNNLKQMLASEQQKTHRYKQEIEENINELTSLMKTLSNKEEEIISLKGATASDGSSS